MDNLVKIGSFHFKLNILNLKYTLVSVKSVDTNSTPLDIPTLIQHQFNRKECLC